MHNWSKPLIAGVLLCGSALVPLTTAAATDLTTDIEIKATAGKATSSELASTMRSNIRSLALTMGKVDIGDGSGGFGWRGSSSGLADFRDTSVSSNAFFAIDNGGLRIQPGVLPSDAIADIFNNPGTYGLDCSSAIVAIVQYARLRTLGGTDFNNLYPGTSFYLKGWKDLEKYRYTRFSTTNTSRRYTSSGSFTVNGTTYHYLKGESVPFSPSMGDKLTPGGAYFFEAPGNNSTDTQGYNAVYIGKSGANYKFFKSPGGIFQVTFDTANKYLVKTTTFDDLAHTYLSANTTLPSGSLLAGQDDTSGD